MYILYVRMHAHINVGIKCVRGSTNVWVHQSDNNNSHRTFLK